MQDVPRQTAVFDAGCSVTPCEENFHRNIGERLAAWGVLGEAIQRVPAETRNTKIWTPLSCELQLTRALFGHTGMPAIDALKNIYRRVLESLATQTSTSRERP